MAAGAIVVLRRESVRPPGTALVVVTDSCTARPARPRVQRHLAADRARRAARCSTTHDRSATGRAPSSRTPSSPRVHGRAAASRVTGSTAPSAFVFVRSRETRVGDVRPRNVRPGRGQAGQAPVGVEPERIGAGVLENGAPHTGADDLLAERGHRRRDAGARSGHRCEPSSGHSFRRSTLATRTLSCRPWLARALAPAGRCRSAKGGRQVLDPVQVRPLGRAQAAGGP